MASIEQRQQQVDMRATQALCGLVAAVVVCFVVSEVELRVRGLESLLREQSKDLVLLDESGDVLEHVRLRGQSALADAGPILPHLIGEITHLLDLLFSPCATVQQQVLELVQPAGELRDAKLRTELDAITA